MKLKTEKLKKLMNDRYNGNYHTFARAIGFDVSSLHKILNNQMNAGLKSINKIIEFLKSQNLKVEEYIFLL